MFDLAFSLTLTALPSGWIARSEPPSISQMKPREACDLGYTLQVAGRGEYRWPTLRCESTFPFSLFRAWQEIPFGLSSTRRGARTWVTPAIIDSDLPGLIQAMLSRGQQSDGMRAGESLEYLGSREYTYGDFVRRWDIASWARLGRPIVRQFDQSSTGNLTIVVDTFLGSQTPANGDVSFETRLSLAASIIQSLRFTSCHIDLIFPKSEGIELVQADPSMQETLLRPLATVIGLHRDRNSTGLTSQKNGWEIVRSMLEPDNTLICTMGPTDTLRLVSGLSTPRHDPVDSSQLNSFALSRDPSGKTITLEIENDARRGEFFFLPLHATSVLGVGRRLTLDPNGIAQAGLDTRHTYSAIVHQFDSPSPISSPLRETLHRSLKTAKAETKKKFRISGLILIGEFGNCSKRGNGRLPWSSSRN